MNAPNSVSGSSSTDVWAVGYYLTDFPDLEHRALVLHWDGAHWSSETGPSIPGPDASVVLNGVATGSAGPWAVGYHGCCTYDFLIAERDSSGWQVLPSPHPGPGDNVFGAVDVNSVGDGWAAGYYRNGTSIRAFIAECC